MIQLRERNPLLDHAWGISLAEDRVWAQISGFAPSTKPWKRLLVVLQACIDDSYSSRTGLFVLGGAIAPVEAWAAFSRDWEQILHFARLNKNGKRVFKISEMRDSPDFPVFYRTAKDHVLAIISLLFTFMI